MYGTGGFPAAENALKEPLPLHSPNLPSARILHRRCGTDSPPVLILFAAIRS